MHSLTDRIDALFSSAEGSAILQTVSATMERHGMTDMLRSGVAVGFSGGPDSVLLLSLLVYLKRQGLPVTTIVAIHVNHLIRGKSAYSDADAALAFCTELGVELVIKEIDVPAISRETGIGIEEAARNARYSAFEGLMDGRNNVSCVALAHNATDNVETVLMHLVRGSGIRGMCGIPPVRDYILRPLIDLSKRAIVGVLDRFDIPYVLDESNSSDEYTRNYVRHNVLPHLELLSPSYERSVGRMVDNMRSAYSLISSLADEVLKEIGDTGSFSVELLRDLHPAVFADAFSRLVYSRCGVYPEEGHIKTALSFIGRDNFSLSLVGEYDLVCQRGICFFANKLKKEASDVIFELKLGENIIHGTSVVVYVEQGAHFKDFSSNIYKFSIYADVNGDIINEGLILRFRREGDAYKFGGITRRLKKVFNDRGIPPFMRGLIPIVCDRSGILWVPGLPLRDGSAPSDPASAARITVCFGIDGERELFAATPYNNSTNT